MDNLIFTKNYGNCIYINNKVLLFEDWVLNNLRYLTLYFLSFFFYLHALLKYKKKK